MSGEKFLTVASLLFSCFQSITVFAGNNIKTQFVSQNASLWAAVLSIDASSSGAVYSYAPAIIKENGVYHMFYCAYNNVTPGGWDAVRHATSTDGVTYGASDVVLFPSSDATDRSVCDPSVVYFKGYYYLYYSGNTHNIGTDMYVARASSIGGPYAKYTQRGTWEVNAWDPKIIIYPAQSVPDGPSGFPDWYGAGQQTVISRGNYLVAWYSDTNTQYPHAQVETLMMTTSEDGVNWTPAQIATTNADFTASVDIKYDAVNNRYVKYDLGDGQQRSPYLRRSFSQNGLNWSPPEILADKNGIPAFANNIGISSDNRGYLLSYQEQSVIGFGGDKSNGGCPDGPIHCQIDGLYTMLVNGSLGASSVQPTRTKPYDDFRLSPLVYNDADYSALNPDLVSLGVQGRINHWLTFGINEGRIASRAFHSVEYINMYADLKQAFGPSRNYLGAIQHFVEYGYSNSVLAGRYVVHPYVFDPDFYRNRYSDLAWMDRFSARSHWTHNGIAERRLGISTFYVVDYLNRYGDLLNAFGSTGYEAAIAHYVTYGFNEGRNGSPASTSQIQAQIANLYQSILGRAPDSGGLAYYTQQAVAGRSLSSIEAELRASPEAALRSFYLIHLKREPDIPGKNYWLSQIQSGAQTLEQVRTNIRLSSECKYDCLRP